MTALEISVIIVAGLYVFQCSVFIAGVAIARYQKNQQNEPTVSVVVAARNEEANIEKCLLSLSQIEYPREKLDIIIADDNSDDATPSIIERFTRSQPHISSIAAQPSSTHLQGKANAIAQAIDIAKGEIILMTDADCVVGPMWVRNTVQYYDERTGVVAGLTLLHSKNWFEGMQSLDWAYILAVAAAAMALRNPLSCIGNNFSFRKEAYDEVGGYRGIKFSVTEDFALFKAITETGRWNYLYPFDSGTLVLSSPCRTARDLYRQKRRWGVGGRDMPFKAIGLLIIGFLMHVVLFAAPFLHFERLCLAGFVAIKFSFDALLLFVPLSRVKYLSQMKYFFHFELYYIVSTILLPFAVFFGGKVLWKGRAY